MMQVPVFMIRDNYLQNPIMREFLKEKKLGIYFNNPEYIEAIEKYANKSQQNEAEVENWLLKIAKEGSKLICYKKIYEVDSIFRNYKVVESIIRERYKECPMKNILNYINTNKKNMIEYKIIKDENNRVSKIEFTFSKLFLCGEVSKEGIETVVPVFIEVYLNEGFVISRCKSKTTVYEYNKVDKILHAENKVNLKKYAVSLIDEIIQVFGFKYETNSQILRSHNSQMLYRIYDKFTFTPKEVVNMVESMNTYAKAFVNKVFNELSLDIRNKDKALLDLNIFIEKYISINGDNQEIFKEDRDAYLIHVSSDNRDELTKIDTKSNKTKPLQCTEVFFDSKKSVINSKECGKIYLVFKRKNKKIFPNQNQLVVQFDTASEYGYIQTMQYAEEDDLQYVLQTIFENY